MATSNWWDKLKQNVGLNAPEEEPQSNSLLQHLDEVSTLNRTQVKELSLLSFCLVPLRYTVSMQRFSLLIGHHKNTGKCTY